MAPVVKKSVAIVLICYSNVHGFNGGWLVGFMIV